MAKTKGLEITAHARRQMMADQIDPRVVDLVVKFGCKVWGKLICKELTSDDLEEISLHQDGTQLVFNKHLLLKGDLKKKHLAQENWNELIGLTVVTVKNKVIAVYYDELLRRKLFADKFDPADTLQKTGGYQSLIGAS